MNKYGSITRQYTIRNVYEDTLTVGTDIVIPSGDSYDDLKTAEKFTFDTNQQTNFLIRRAGVFSNFADGLVFKNPEDRIDIDMSFRAYKRNQVYDLNVTYGSKAVTAVGTTGWIPGNHAPISIFGIPQIVLFVDVTGANSGNLEDYWMYDTGLVNARTLTLEGVGTEFSFKNVSTLNCLYDVDEPAYPFLISTGSGDYDLIAFHCGLNLQTDHTTTLMTDIIDTAFEQQTVFFDVVAEIEFTKA